MRRTSWTVLVRLSDSWHLPRQPRPREIRTAPAAHRRANPDQRQRLQFPRRPQPARVKRLEADVARHPRDRRLRRRIPWQFLDGAPVLLISPEANPNYGQIFLRTCGEHRVSPAINYAAGDLSALIRLVSAGLGVCPYPSSLTTTAPPGIVFRPFSPACAPLDLVLLWSRENPSPLLRAFLSHFIPAR